MSHKRPLSAPPPIFNKGKRPRHALMAHPNNQGDFMQETIELKHYEGRSQYQRKENRAPFPLQQPINTTYKLHQVQPQPSPQFSHEMVTHTWNQCQERGHSFTQTHYGGEEATTQMGTHVRFSDSAATGAAYTRAQEPVEAASMHSSGKSKQWELRVLTATAQGVEHWSQYKSHTGLLFEVYGILDLLLAKTDDRVQQFKIRTVDGLLKCLFWEMEQSFPTIVTGQRVRVVGDWESQRKNLKCYSVRLASKAEEEELVRQKVALADAYMRRLVEKL